MATWQKMDLTSSMDDEDDTDDELSLYLTTGESISKTEAVIKENRSSKERLISLSEQSVLVKGNRKESPIECYDITKENKNTKTISDVGDTSSECSMANEMSQFNEISGIHSSSDKSNELMVNASGDQKHESEVECCSNPSQSTICTKSSEWAQPEDCLSSLKSVKNAKMEIISNQNSTCTEQQSDSCEIRGTLNNLNIENCKQTVSGKLLKQEGNSVIEDYNGVFDADAQLKGSAEGFHMEKENNLCRVSVESSDTQRYEGDKGNDNEPDDELSFYLMYGKKDVAFMKVQQQISGEENSEQKLVTVQDCNLAIHERIITENNDCISDLKANIGKTEVWKMKYDNIPSQTDTVIINESKLTTTAKMHFENAHKLMKRLPSGSSDEHISLQAGITDEKTAVDTECINNLKNVPICDTVDLDLDMDESLSSHVAGQTNQKMTTHSVNEIKYDFPVLQRRCEIQDLKLSQCNDALSVSSSLDTHPSLVMSGTGIQNDMIEPELSKEYSMGLAKKTQNIPGEKRKNPDSQVINNISAIPKAGFINEDGDSDGIDGPLVSYLSLNSKHDNKGGLQTDESSVHSCVVINSAACNNSHNGNNSKDFDDTECPVLPYSSSSQTMHSANALSAVTIQASDTTQETCIIQEPEKAWKPSPIKKEDLESLKKMFDYSSEGFTHQVTIKSSTDVVTEPHSPSEKGTEGSSLVEITILNAEDTNKTQEFPSISKNIEPCERLFDNTYTNIDTNKNLIDLNVESNENQTFLHAKQSEKAEFALVTKKFLDDLRQNVNDNKDHIQKSADTCPRHYTVCSDQKTDNVLRGLQKNLSVVSDISLSRNKTKLKDSALPNAQISEVLSRPLGKFVRKNNKLHIVRQVHGKSFLEEFLPSKSNSERNSVEKGPAVNMAETVNEISINKTSLGPNVSENEHCANNSNVSIESKQSSYSHIIGILPSPSKSGNARLLLKTSVNDDAGSSENIFNFTTTQNTHIGDNQVSNSRELLPATDTYEEFSQNSKSGIVENVNSGDSINTVQADNLQEYMAEKVSSDVNTKNGISVNCLQDEVECNDTHFIENELSRENKHASADGTKGTINVESNDKPVYFNSEDSSVKQYKNVNEDTATIRVFRVEQSPYKTGRARRNFIILQDDGRYKEIEDVEINLPAEHQKQLFSSPLALNTDSDILIPESETSAYVSKLRTNLFPSTFQSFKVNNTKPLTFDVATQCLPTSCTCTCHGKTTSDSTTETIDGIKQILQKVKSGTKEGLKQGKHTVIIVKRNKKLGNKTKADDHGNKAFTKTESYNHRNDTPAECTKRNDDKDEEHANFVNGHIIESLAEITKFNKHRLQHTEATTDSECTKGPSVDVTKSSMYGNGEQLEVCNKNMKQNKKQMYDIEQPLNTSKLNHVISDSDYKDTSVANSSKTSFRVPGHRELKNLVIDMKNQQKGGSYSPKATSKCSSNREIRVCDKMEHSNLGIDINRKHKLINDGSTSLKTAFRASEKKEQKNLKINMVTENKTDVSSSNNGSDMVGDTSVRTRLRKRITANLKNYKLAKGKMIADTKAELDHEVKTIDNSSDCSVAGKNKQTEVDMIKPSKNREGKSVDDSELALSLSINDSTSTFTPNVSGAMEECLKQIREKEVKYFIDTDIRNDGTNQCKILNESDKVCTYRNKRGKGRSCIRKLSLDDTGSKKSDNFFRECNMSECAKTYANYMSNSAKTDNTQREQTNTNTSLQSNSEMGSDLMVKKDSQMLVDDEYTSLKINPADLRGEKKSQMLVSDQIPFKSKKENRESQKFQKVRFKDTNLDRRSKRKKVDVPKNKEVRTCLKKTKIADVSSEVIENRLQQTCAVEQVTCDATKENKAGHVSLPKTSSKIPLEKNKKSNRKNMRNKQNRALRMDSNGKDSLESVSNVAVFGHSSLTKLQHIMNKKEQGQMKEENIPVKKKRNKNVVQCAHSNMDSQALNQTDMFSNSETNDSKSSEKKKRSDNSTSSGRKSESEDVTLSDNVKQCKKKRTSKRKNVAALKTMKMRKKSKAKMLKCKKKCFSLQNQTWKHLLSDKSFQFEDVIQTQSKPDVKHLKRLLNRVLNKRENMKKEKRKRNKEDIVAGRSKQPQSRIPEITSKPNVDFQAFRFSPDSVEKSSCSEADTDIENTYDSLVMQDVKNSVSSFCERQGLLVTNRNTFGSHSSWVHVGKTPECSQVENYPRSHSFNIDIRDSLVEKIHEEP